MELKKQNEEIQQCEIRQSILSNVVNSPIKKDDNTKSHVSPKKKHNYKKIMNHYDAWGGAGLDELLSKSKKGGSLYEMHVKLETKKRLLKQQEKENNNAEALLSIPPKKVEQFNCNE